MIFRYLFFAFFVVIPASGVLYYIGAQNNIGYCLSAGKVLSEKELVAAFVEQMPGHEVRRRSSPINSTDDQPVYLFSSGIEYHKAVPDCCRELRSIVREGKFGANLTVRPPDTWQRVKGYAFTMIVSLSAGLVKHADGEYHVKVMRTTESGVEIWFKNWVDACGKIVRIPQEFILE